MQCGHANFIMYNNNNQPGCSADDIKCAHSKAREYFRDTLNPEVELIGYNKDYLYNMLNIWNSIKYLDKVGIHNLRNRGTFSVFDMVLPKSQEEFENISKKYKPIRFFSQLEKPLSEKTDKILYSPLFD